MRALIVCPAPACLPGRGQERHCRSLTVFPRPQILGPGQERKQVSNACSLYPFVVQLHSNIFTQKKLLNRNKKQKHHINLTEFLLRCGQSSQTVKLSDFRSDSDLVYLRDSVSLTMNVAQSFVIIIKGRKSCKCPLNELW